MKVYIINDEINKKVIEFNNVTRIEDKNYPILKLHTHCNNYYTGFIIYRVPKGCYVDVSL